MFFTLLARCSEFEVDPERWLTSLIPYKDAGEKTLLREREREERLSLNK